MKRFLLNIKTLILRGYLRIFPIRIDHALITLVFLSVLSVVSCSTPKYATQLVRDIQRDTVYLSNTQYDSIYIYKDRLTDRSRDTVYLKDVSIEYRYKMLRDTVRIIQRDSIPYEVVRIETKEITRPLTAFDRICRLCFYFLLGVLITYSWMKLRKVFKR